MVIQLRSALMDFQAQPL